jgi:undecaprenyl-phosphate 4-deoxy-4-formamido-L-arabinose transferase
VITLDADLQNPPEEIPNLVRTIEQGNDVVGTIRRNRQDSFFRRKASACINWMVQKSTGVAMRDYGCMLRAYRRPVVNAILQCRERSTFIPVLANTFAKRAAEIEVGHAERAAGESKYSLWKLINLQFDLLTSMTTTPLRLLSWAGAAIALGGFGFGVLLLAGRIFLGAEWAENGVFTLFAILFIFVGAQFIGMGLLGEYLGRVYHDVRGRPRYFIDHIAGDSGLKRSTPDPDEAAESAESPHGVTIETGISL